MMEIGRLCMKIAGRDANKHCVVVEIFEDNYVLIDGETRRKKCNIKHLEPLDKVVNLKKGASRSDIKKVFTELGLGFFEPKSKKSAARVKKTKVKKEIVKDKKKKDLEKKQDSKKVAEDKTPESDNVGEDPVKEKSS